MYLLPLACGCNYPTGTDSNACDSSGKCTCKDGFTGDKCCQAGYYGSACVGKIFKTLPERFVLLLPPFLKERLKGADYNN